MIKAFFMKKVNDIIGGIIIGLSVPIIIGGYKKIFQKGKKEKELKMNKARSAMNELIPLIQNAEDNLDNLENELISKNYEEFNKYVFKMEETLNTLNKFLDKIEKPKNIKKRLKKKNKGKLKDLTFFEEVYEIYSMLEAIVFLGYGLLTLKEENENSDDAEQNFEEEVNKTYLLIKNIKCKYKVY